MHTSKWLSSAVLSVAFSVPVNAQTGPSDARVLNSTFRVSDTSPDTMARYAVAEFSVSPEGRVPTKARRDVHERRVDADV
jgi:hypothetical protein